MTLTLHWWALPLVLILAAVALAVKAHFRPTYGMLGGLEDGFLPLILSTAAALLVLGHWL